MLTHLFFFGINPEQTTALWYMIDVPKAYYPIHALCGLAFLKPNWTEIQLVPYVVLWQRSCGREFG